MTLHAKIVPPGQLRELEELTERYVGQLSPSHKRWLMGENRGLTEETIERARLGSVLRGKFRGCVSIPYLNTEGLVVDIRYRPVDYESDSKYLTRKGAVTRMYYAGRSIRDKEPVFVCEGEFDALVMQQLGLQAVGFPGVKTAKPHHISRIAKCKFPVIVGDGDEAGGEFGHELRAQVRQAAILQMPEGEDATSLSVKNVDCLYKLVAEALETFSETYS